MRLLGSVGERSLDLVSSQTSDIQFLGRLDKPGQILSWNFYLSLVHEVHDGEEVLVGQATDVDIALILFGVLKDFPEE